MALLRRVEKESDIVDEHAFRLGARRCRVEAHRKADGRSSAIDDERQLDDCPVVRGVLEALEVRSGAAVVQERRRTEGNADGLGRGGVPPHPGSPHVPIVDCDGYRWCW